MNKKEQVNKLIDEAINSVDNIVRASPMPFLLTRVNARLSNTNENVWEKMMLFIGRPAISIPGLALLIFMNVLVIFFNGSDQFTTATDQAAQGDEFSYSVSTIYDIENTEP